MLGQSLTGNYENSHQTIAQDITTLVMVLKITSRTRDNITSYFPSFQKVFCVKPLESCILVKFTVAVCALGHTRQNPFLPLQLLNISGLLVRKRSKAWYNPVPNNGYSVCQSESSLHIKTLLNYYWSKSKEKMSYGR